jgi:hypothetical protein
MQLYQHAAAVLQGLVPVRKHPDYSESGYLLAVETAFNNWEAIQNASR